jgi:acyl carrier protein
MQRWYLGNIREFDIFAKKLLLMAKITENTRNEVREIVLAFFAEECETDKSQITDNTNIIKDLDGDSLMFLELIEIFKKKYNLDIELKTIGKYAVKHPVETIGQLIEMQMLIIEHENRLLELDK